MSYDPKRPRCDVSDCKRRAMWKGWVELGERESYLWLCKVHLEDDLESIGKEIRDRELVYASEAGDRAWKERVEG